MCKYILSIKIFVKHLMLFIVPKFNMRMKLNITLFNILSNVMSWHLTYENCSLSMNNINKSFNNISVGFYFCDQNTLTMQQLGNLILLFI